MPPTRPIHLRFLDKYEMNIDTGCWEWKGAVSRGYGYLGRRNDTPIAAHRYSYQHFNGKIPDGMLVLHSCDNSLCVNPDHLRLGTHEDNMQDMARAGRRRGRHTGSALPQKALDKLTKLLSEGASQRVAASAIGINRTTVQRLIKSGNLGAAPTLRARLTEDQRSQILAMLMTGETVSGIAATFGVDRKTVRNIRAQLGGEPNRRASAEG